MTQFKKYVLKEDIKMSAKELLVEAERRYPIGTRYKCAYSAFNYIRDVPFHDNGDDKHIHCNNGDRGFVYYKGKRAEIISLPEDKELPKDWYCAVKEDNLELCKEWQRLQPDWNGGMASKGIGVLSKHSTYDSYYFHANVKDFKENVVEWERDNGFYKDYKKITTDPLQQIVDNFKKVNNCKQINKKEDGNKSSKENSTNLQRVNFSVRRHNRGRKPRFASTESEIRNRGGFSRKQKRPSFSQTEII